MLRERIIELLNYPRDLVERTVTGEPCEHGWNYSPTHNDCQHCWHGIACDWLQHNDGCVDLAGRSLDGLIAALESAMGQIDAHLLSNGHDRRSCRCDTCNWYRRAQREYLEWCEHK